MRSVTFVSMQLLVTSMLIKILKLPLCERALYAPSRGFAAPNELLTIHIVIIDADRW